MHLLDLDIITKNFKLRNTATLSKYSGIINLEKRSCTLIKNISIEGHKNNILATTSCYFSVKSVPRDYVRNASVTIDYTITFLPKYK